MPKLELWSLPGKTPTETDEGRHPQERMKVWEMMRNIQGWCPA